MPKASLKKGDNVEFEYAGKKGSGKVSSVQEKKVTKTIKGKAITRNGSKDNPAVEVTQDNGNKTLKKASQVKKK
jgi:hypothetical protein